MRVRELIKWLKTQNQEDFVGILDYGQDSGDWDDLQIDNKIDMGVMGNLKILNYNEAIDKMKKDGSIGSILHFKEKYDALHAISETKQNGDAK